MLKDMYGPNILGILAVAACLSQTNVRHVSVGCQECIQTEAQFSNLKIWHLPSFQQCSMVVFMLLHECGEQAIDNCLNWESL